MSRFETITVFVGLGSILLLSLQLYLARVSLNIGIKRSKMQSTIDALNIFGDRIRKSNLNLNGVINIKGNDVISISDIEKIQNDMEVKHQVLLIMSAFERIGVGVHNDIFDIDIVYKDIRYSVMKNWGYFYPYIKNSRKENSTFYECFENMADLMYCRSRKNEEPIPSSYISYRNLCSKNTK